jgi:hypothetical protein
MATSTLTDFHSCSSLFRCLLVHRWGFHFGIIHVPALCLSQCNPTAFLALSPYPVFLFNSFQCVSLCLVLTQMWCISSSFTDFLSFFSSFLSLLYQSHLWVHVLYIFLCIYITCVCIGCLFHI